MVIEAYKYYSSTR